MSSCIILICSCLPAYCAGFSHFHMLCYTSRLDGNVPKLQNIINSVVFCIIQFIDSIYRNFSHTFFSLSGCCVTFFIITDN